MKTIYFNQDNHHFYGSHPPEDMSAEGLDRLVDVYAQGTQLKALLFCVNVQRALFPSKHWETFWDGYDPEKGENQPAARRTHGVHNLWLLQQRGLDQFERWLARCRDHGLEGWLTMRMNDSHGLVEYARQAPPPHPLEEWPSEYWRRHPELRRAPYRWERSWEGSFDYGKPEVRTHHLNLVQELFERYDMFGLELDWMRWGMMFAPGGEGAGRAILTEFVREVRRLADSAARRLGHPVQLAHRLPADPQSCLALGYDPITWAREGLADMVTLSAFGCAANFDYPISIWRSMLGSRVKLLAHAEPSVYEAGESVRSYEFLYGSAASALHRGVDGIYLFNECYRESDDRELLAETLNNAGNIESLQKISRRHAFTHAQITAPGEPRKFLLPVPLRHTDRDRDFGRWDKNITLRIATGSRPQSGRVFLCLGFSVQMSSAEGIIIRLNTTPLSPCLPAEWETLGDRWIKRVTHEFTRMLSTATFALWREIPLHVMQDDINVVEFEPPQEDGMLEWAEIILLV